MKLISCHIENFGKLHDCSMNFGPGLNSLCRENGWGKSTFAAFLCVMFYGFENTTSGNLEKNDRKRYLPWQGGPYGGTITFAVGERRYRLTRLFGDKAVNDEFELRDADTNLPSGDYGLKIGEELFGINKESFARTVYIAQSKCETAATDDMNAGIGRLTDAVNDMGSFEKAIELLNAQRNALNPRRATGSIKKREAEIAELAGTVQAGAALEEALEQTGRLCAEQEEQLHLLQERKTELAGLLKKAIDEEMLLGKRQEWERMRTAALERKSLMQQHREQLPDYLPSREELREAFACSSAMDRAALTAENSELTEHEAEEFNRLQDAGEPEQQMEEEAEGEPVRSAKPLLLFGLLLLATGAGLMLMKYMFGAIVLSIGLILTIAAVVLQMGRVASRMTPQMEELKEAIRRQGEEIAAKQAAMLDFLNEKQNRFHEAVDEYDRQHTRLEDMIRSWGLEVEEHPETQLKSLAAELEDYEAAVQEYKGRLGELKEFEDGIDKELLRNLNPLDVPSAEAIRRELEEAEAECREADSRLSVYRRQLELLEEQTEQWEEQANRLEQLRRVQAQEQNTYRYLTKAEELLTKAKENMTAKYTDPILRSFTEYYESITGQEHPFAMDANTNITLWEQGKQRKPETLSAGMRDLVGICLRAAFADAMYEEERPMLILDDPFTNLDDDKTEAAKAFLRKLSERYQVIYFTCSSFRQ